jgi:cytidine deaminase
LNSFSNTSREVNNLIEQAYRITKSYRSSNYCTSGAVGAALLTKDGNIYTGVCIEASCGLGFCAEHSAIAEMLKHRESEIIMLVALNVRKQMAAPCGRCRELIYQVNPLNVNTKIMLSEDKSILLKELLPLRWQETWQST